MSGPLDVSAFAAKGDILLCVRSEEAAGSAVRLKAHSTLLSLASPLLEEVLQLCGAAPDDSGCKLLTVDGPAQAWRDVLNHLYAAFLPPPDRSPLAAAATSAAILPAAELRAGGSAKRKAAAAAAESAAAACDSQVFTWESVTAMLPVLHKYQFTALLGRVVAWIGTQEMSGDPASPAYALTWLDVADTLHLDGLAATCHEQLAQLPLSLSPQHPGYVRSVLRLADERQLPALQARCLALLNTGSAEGVGSGVPPSLEPGSSNYVLDLLELVHSSAAHFEELQPCRKKCMRAIRKAAEKGLLGGQGGGGGGDTPQSYSGAGLVRELLGPGHAGHGSTLSRAGSGTPSGLGEVALLNVPAPAVADPGARAGAESNGAAAINSSAPATGAFAAGNQGCGSPCTNARMDGLRALAEGLLSRSALLDQVTSSMTSAREVYLCNNCSHGVVLFKPSAPRKMPSWLRFVSHHQQQRPASLMCPVCGNSCAAQPNASDTRVLYPMEG